MIFTYELTPGGYRIFADGQLLIDQPFDPAKPFVDGAGQPFDDEAAATAHAESMIASMTPAA